MPIHRMMTMLKLSVACPLLLAMVIDTKAEERSALPKAKRILFLGNSITLHGPAAAIGWTNNWGMAATPGKRITSMSLRTPSPDSRAVRPKCGSTISPTSRGTTIPTIWTPSSSATLDFKPDIVVVAIGENVPALISEDAKTKFKARFTKLLTAAE